MFGLHLTTATRWLASAALALSIGACASDGEDFQAGSPPIDEGTPGGGGNGDTCVAATVLAQTCGGCHSGATAPQGLDLASAGLKGRVANVAAKGCSGEILVVPGDPGASYLLAKINGSHAEGCGVQMPKGGTPLDAATQNCIADWIEQMTATSGGGGGGGSGGGGGGGW